MTLLNAVRERLPDDTRAEVKALVLAACLGERALTDLLEHGELPDEDTTKSGELEASPAAYLERISVTGFRGIGESTALDLGSGPGLTLVVGRNGSGKSSFAEALEYALTGGNARWDERSKIWQQGWRNLHASNPPSIEVALSIDGESRHTVVERRWDEGSDLDDHRVTITDADGGTTLTALGWDRDLDLYRPFLPYSELGALVDKGPTALHDTLSAVLGLDQLSSAADGLRSERLARNKERKEHLRRANDLVPDLSEIDDDRARRCVGQLRTDNPSLKVVRDVLEGTDQQASAGMDTLRRGADLSAPDVEEAERIAEELEAAVEEVRGLDGTDAGRSLELANLLAHAIDIHAAHGEDSCPVCGVGELDASWLATARRRESELRASAGAAERARSRLRLAERSADGFVVKPPQVLEQLEAFGIPAAGPLQTYASWAKAVGVADPLEKAAALRSSTRTVAEAIRNVAAGAADLLRQREDAWREVYPRVAAWLERAAPAFERAERIEDLQQAERLLRDVTDEIRAERWRPISELAKQIWEDLRHQSNVEIRDVALSGSGTRRRVDVDVAVDGADGAALSVMSQGELHALALSLFLPRATLDESPFRFVVIDDPVQSMDPARVDGLARVLSEVAKTRQVIVFTHDDRLPEAVRRLQLGATVVQVVRGTQSKVEVRTALTPVEQYLDDARALVRSNGLPELLARRSAPLFCRLAIEAACAVRTRRRDLRAGVPHAEVEAALEENSQLIPLLALALWGDAGRASEVMPHLDTKVGRWAADVVRCCKEGSHQGHAGDLVGLVRDTERLVTGVLR